jgi:hypothetical protein
MKEKSRRVIAYMKNHKAFSYPGGVPTSMVKSGQQWDFRCKTISPGVGNFSHKLCGKWIFR